MNAEQRANLMAWLRYCEAHPDLWAQPDAIRIPLDQVGLTWDEVAELFEQPTLAEVRRAVEERLAEEAPCMTPVGDVSAQTAPTGEDGGS